MMGRPETTLLNLKLMGQFNSPNGVAEFSFRKVSFKPLLKLNFPGVPLT